MYHLFWLSLVRTDVFWAGRIFVELYTHSVGEEEMRPSRGSNPGPCVSSSSALTIELLDHSWRNHQLQHIHFTPMGDQKCLTITSLNQEVKPVGPAEAARAGI
jgi:hypothetical protein